MADCSAEKQATYAFHRLYIRSIFIDAPTHYSLLKVVLQLTNQRADWLTANENMRFLMTAARISSGIKV